MEKSISGKCISGHLSLCSTFCPDWLRVHAYPGATWGRPDGPARTECLYINIYVPYIHSNLLIA